MLLGEVLIANGFVSRADVEAALARQRESGGVLGENLIALGSMSEEALRRAMQLAPAEPRNGSRRPPRPDDMQGIAQAQCTTS